MLPEARLGRRNEVGDTADVILSKKLLPEWQGIETFQRGEGGWLPLGPSDQQTLLLAPPTCKE